MWNRERRSPPLRSISCQNQTGSVGRVVGHRPQVGPSERPASDASVTTDRPTGHFHLPLCRLRCETQCRRLVQMDIQLARTHGTFVPIVTIRTSTTFNTQLLIAVDFQRSGTTHPAFVPREIVGCGTAGAFSFPCTTDAASRCRAITGIRGTGRTNPVSGFLANIPSNPPPGCARRVHGTPARGSEPSLASSAC